MELKWLFIAMAVAMAGLCGMGAVAEYSEGQVKVAHEQTITACYNAAKVNPNITCTNGSNK